jgi:transposase-like protein
MEHGTRRLLAVQFSWTRNGLIAHAFLKHLNTRYGIRVVVADGALWYRWACVEVGLRLQVEPGGGRSLLERLNKEVKRRLKDFDISFPGKSLSTARAWLKAWKAHYNWVRHHMAPGGPPCGKTPGPEPLRMLTLIKDVSLT